MHHAVSLLNELNSSQRVAGIGSVAVDSAEDSKSQLLSVTTANNIFFAVSLSNQGTFVSYFKILK